MFHLYFRVRPSGRNGARISIVTCRTWDYNTRMISRYTSTLLGLLLAATMHAATNQPWPTPPQQTAPWTAPETVPTNLVSVAETLFAQGFPDPRGCEYRQITIEVGSVWGAPRRFLGGTNLVTETEAHRVETTGWVLPETSGSTQRFAIGWNGLIYPVVALGMPVDLETQASGWSPVVQRFQYASAMGEELSVFATNAVTSRVLLLLRAGQTQPGLKHFQALTQPSAESGSRRASLPPGTNSDPYLDFATDWAWALFDQSVGAHMRGDVLVALAATRMLAKVQPQIEAEAARRGFQRQRYYDGARRNQEQPYLNFLDQLPVLLADLERRGREGERIPALTCGLTNFTTPAERIAALIQNLDLVAARQWSQPGGVMLVQDPVVAALVQDGDAAVPALIDCLATDQRLTRSVNFGRDFMRQRNLIPASSAARAALQAITQTDFPTAAAWRAYWEKFKGMRLEERWFTILQDDKAGMAQWLDIASHLTRPNNVFTIPGTRFSSTTPAPSNAPPQMRGEWLRNKSQPSVSDLLTRRVLEISPTNWAGYDLNTAMEICLRLAAWDATSAGPVATQLAQRYLTLAHYSDAPSGRWSEQQLTPQFARLSGIRMQAKEPGAFTDYANWLKTSTPERFGSYLAEGLKPLLDYSSNAVLQTAAASLFSETNSAWGQLPWKGGSYFKPMESGLVKLSAFRELLARELEVTNVCGTLEWSGAGLIRYQLTNEINSSGSRTFALPETEQPANGTKVALRWCDWVALSIAIAKEIPPFNPFVSPEKRDAMTAHAKVLLQNP